MEGFVADGAHPVFARLETFLRVELDPHRFAHEFEGFLSDLSVDPRDGWWHVFGEFGRVDGRGF